LSRDDAILAFIHVAKTGGQTVDTMLASSFGVGHAATIDWRDPPDDPWAVDYVVPKYDAADFRRLKKLCPFMKSVGGHGVTLWSQLETVQPTRYFAILREPIARGASHFQYHRQHDTPCLDWDRWVDWSVHHNHQVKMFSPTADPEQAIREIQAQEVFVGLTERFDESLVMLQKLVAPELNIAYSRTNVARDRSIADSLLADTRTRDQIKHMYRDEFALYEFVSREWYPRLQQAYGPTLEKDVEEFRRHRQGRLNRANVRLNGLYRKLVIRPRAKAYRRKSRYRSE